MKLGELFRTEVITAKPDDTTRSVVDAMKGHNVGAVVVVQGRKVVGIVTDRDVALAIGLEKATPASPVRDIMTENVVTIWDDQGIFNATQYLLGHKIRRLPIINRDNELVGMLTFDDLLTLFSKEIYNISVAVSPAVGEEKLLLERERLAATN